MTTVIQQALGEAYGLHQVNNNAVAAVEKVRGVLADPAVRDEARTHLTELGALVRARSQGGRCGDHISKINHDILSEALREA